MSKDTNLEGRTIARLRDPKTTSVVGFLILWETGDIDPLWLRERCPDVNIEWLYGEERKGFHLSD